MIWRLVLSLLWSVGLTLAIGPAVIRKMKSLHFGQTIYELGPAHQQKQGTPLMGGVMMAAATLTASLIFHPTQWKGLWDFSIPLLGLSFLSMAVGFADDWIKAVKKRHEGLTPWQKISGQVIAAVLMSVYCYFNPQIGSAIRIPFTQTEWDLGIFYIPVTSLFIIFMVNSSNLQDGLDGLLSTVTVISSGTWAIISLVLILTTGSDGGDEVMTGVYALALAGSCIGFLRFNRYPAKIFMGDTGSMLLGGGTVALALVLRLPMLLLLTFIGPVMSSVSVIIQRYYFKLTHGKRIFLMSPIHHHFEKKGYSETQIVCMYAGVTAILSMIAVLSVCNGI